MRPVDYVVHVEREPGRRVIREVLRLDDYDRRSQQFKFEIVSGPNSALNPQTQSHWKGHANMPLLEIVQIRQVTASIRLDESTAAQIDQYAAFLHASADEVVDKALTYVFAKDRDFQDFLRTPEAARAPESLRIRRVPQNGAAVEPANGARKSAQSAEASNGSRPRS